MARQMTTGKEKAHPQPERMSPSHMAVYLGTVGGPAGTDLLVSGSLPWTTRHRFLDGRELHHLVQCQL